MLENLPGGVEEEKSLGCDVGVVFVLHVEGLQGSTGCVAVRGKLR
jgi:hypothetical protein